MKLLWILSEMRTEVSDYFFIASTYLGEELVCMIFLCMLYWCISKNMAKKAGYAFFISGLLVQGLKIGFKVPRPWVIDSEFQPVTWAVKSATGYSFPSGHTQNAVAIYGMLAFNSKKVWGKIILCSAVVLVMISRMYLGVHTFWDVLLSFIITIIIVYFINKRSVENFSKSFAVLVIFLCVSLIIESAVLLSAKYIEAEYVHDCFKAAGAGIGFICGSYIEETKIKFEVKTSRIYLQAVKLIIGCIILFAIKTGIKLIFGEAFIVDLIRYMAVVFFVLAGYPYMIKKISKVSRKNT